MLWVIIYSFKGLVLCVVLVCGQILVTFTQILSKVATIYPVQLPSVFTSFWGNFNVLSFDLSTLPLNCVFDSNFHDRLVLTTTAPIVAVLGIASTWLVLRQRMLWKGRDDLNASLSALASKSIRLAVMVLFTVFPMVSTTIFQTFQYDERLHDGSAYLRVDYSIQQNDPTHQGYVAYASVMSIVYCFGIPAVSWLALWDKKDAIQKLQVILESLSALEKGELLECQHDGNDGHPHQRKKTVLQNQLVAEAARRFSGGATVDDTGGTDALQIQQPGQPDQTTVKANLLKMEASLKAEDPWLLGLSPLYRDYESGYWWFEIPKFVSTLTLCALITMVPADGASQVFISLSVSIGMMVLFANTRPYLNTSDDILAQFCQTSLTFSMAVGLLELASSEFQVPDFSSVFASVLLGLFYWNMFVDAFVFMCVVCVCGMQPRTCCLDHSSLHAHR